MSKDYGIEYWGKLEERELIFLMELLEEKAKEPIAGLSKLYKKLKEDFVQADSYEEATLKNKFVESITIQH